MGFIQRYKDTKPSFPSQKELKRGAAKRARGEAARTAHELEHEAECNRLRAQESTGAAKRRFEKYARDDAADARDIRSRYGV